MIYQKWGSEWSGLHFGKWGSEWSAARGRRKRKWSAKIEMVLQMLARVFSACAKNGRPRAGGENENGRREMKWVARGPTLTRCRSDSCLPATPHVSASVRVSCSVNGRSPHGARDSRAGSAHEREARVRPEVPRAAANQGRGRGMLPTKN